MIWAIVAGVVAGVIIFAAGRRTERPGPPRDDESECSEQLESCREERVKTREMIEKAQLQKDALISALADCSRP